MPDVNEMDLIREYADRNSELAFAALVQKHVNLVYSVALRYVGNSPDAQDVTQAVFVILTQKAAGLRQRTTLTGWLYETTRLTARQLLRTRTRRQFREQEAYMQSAWNDSETENAWRQLAPLLEEAMTRLNERERTLLALRYFENKSGAEAAALLGIQEGAAHKRAARALEKLRKFFMKRGVFSTTAIIAGAVSAYSVQAAPVGLASVVSTAAMAKGAAASTSTLTLIKGALKIMAWTKAKTAIVSGLAVLLAAGATTISVKEIYVHRMYSWQVPNPDIKALEQAPAQVTILPAKFLKSGGGWVAQNGRALGIGAGIVDMLEFAYTTQARMSFSTELPQDRYDFIANLPQGSEQAMQSEIRRKFGLAGRREMIETNVLVLTVKNPDARGLKRNRTGGRQNNPQFGEYSCVNQPISSLAYFLELYLGSPVIDQTGLKGGFDMDVKWDEPDKSHRNTDGLKQSLLDQLGLELASTNLPIEMLVVERVKY
jgi:uncharacterized protein (TIGR03435 family)